MDLELHQESVWNWNPNKTGIATEALLQQDSSRAQGFIPDGSQLAMQICPGLQPRWVWDCSPNVSGITTRMNLGLELRTAQHFNPDGSGIAMQMDPSLQ